MKKITLTIHTPSLPLEGLTRTFKSSRIARVWAKGLVKDQICGWSVCSVNGWRGGKPFMIPNPATKQWQSSFR